MIRILLIVLTVISLFCSYLWLRVDHLVVANNKLNDDVSQYELTVQSNETTIAQLKESAAQQDKLLTKQNKVNQALHTKLKHKQRELVQLSKTDETVKSWAVEPVPAAISRLLNTTADSS